MTYQIKVRKVCSDCRGTGKNDVSDSEAQRLAREANYTNDVAFPVRVTYRDFQVCRTCGGKGYDEKWVSLVEFEKLMEKNKIKISP